MEIRNTTQLTNWLQICIDKKSHINGRILHAHILRTGMFADTFLSNRLIELYHKCGRLATARRVFDKMPHKNLFSWHAVLSAYCKTSHIDEAHKLFVKMPERNSVSWNTLISALVRSGSEHKALSLFYDMNKAGFMPTNFTLASVFSACGALADSEYGGVCHGFATKIGLDRNIYVGNALLGMYAKCGCMGDAVKAFEDLPEVNEVSFTSMMGALRETDQVEEALRMFRSMHRIGIQIDAISLSSILGVCVRSGREKSDVENGEIDGLGLNVHGQQFHGLTIKLGLEQDLHLTNSLLDMYAKDGDMDSAETIFHSLPEASVVSWNVMIGGYGQKYQTGKAIECMQKMQNRGFEPDEVTHINMLAACVRSGDIETGHEIFVRMANPSLSSWNALLSGYSQIGNHKEALRLFRDMQFRNIKADRTTLAVIFSSCASMGLVEGGKQVHAASVKSLFDDDIYVASGLIGMYSKCNRIEPAKRVFDRTKGQDVVCWNSMIAGLSLNDLDKDAFVLFKNLLENGMVPSRFSYATVLSCCAKLSSLSQGRQVHAQASKDGNVNDVFVGSTLIDMYSKCGHVEEARRVFDAMPRKNTVTWNEMIHGYAQNGRGVEGVSLYEEMVHGPGGVEPDAVTFVAVLTACSHSGLVDRGITILDSMRLDHGVEPLSDHYTCVVDSLGRAGRFREVEALLGTMPCVDNPIVWEVLLSACRLHSNVGLARRAAEELFRLNPRNSAPYVLLANMYSSMGRWDEVRNVRESMIEKQAVKDPGFSWLEHKHELQEFTADDLEPETHGPCCLTG